MSRLFLSQFYIARLLIQIGEDSCAEANRGYFFFKFQVLFYAVTHPPYLRVGKRLITAEQKASAIHAEIRQCSGGQGNGAFAAARFRVLDFRLVAVGVCNGSSDVDFHAVNINIL